jgi:uncharacterized YigZ family protein
MNLPYQIKTIDEFKESTLVEKKSTFIARVYPADAEEKAKTCLTEIKKKYYDATHHCYAYRLADGSFRYSDAGEPSGTAGIRILNAIDHFELSNIIVIVTRYFGGIKLGVGPLGKAYYLASYEVLSESSIISKQLFQKAIIKSKFDKVSSIHKILTDHKSIIIESDYSEDVTYQCLINFNEMTKIFDKLLKTGKNEISIIQSSEFIYK